MKMMLNCKETTEMVLKKKTEKLSMWDKMMLMMHLSMCRFCGLFARQSDIIDSHAAHIEDGYDEHLNDESKERLKKEIQL